MSSTPNTAPAWGILRIADVKAVTGICSHTTIYNAIEAGTFPNSIPLGARSVGWAVDEVQAVTAARVAGAADDEPRIDSRLLAQQALLVVAQHVATQALQQADDHRDGYQVAKDAVLNLSRALLLGGAA